MHSIDIDQIVPALIKAQRLINNAVLNKTNPHFRSRYADLGSVRDAILPILLDHDIALTQTGEVDGDYVVLRTTLMHKSGQWIASTLPLPADAPPQQFGSAFTYQRRYGAAAIVFIFSEEDDDANAAQGSKPRFDSVNPPLSELPQRAANDNKAAKFEAPIDEITGLVAPHTVIISRADRAKRPNLSYVAHWGGVFSEAIKQTKTVPELDMWLHNNVEGLLNAKSHPAVHARIQEIINNRRDELMLAPPNTFLEDLSAAFALAKTGKAVDGIWRNNEAALTAAKAEDYDAAMAIYQSHIDRVAAKAA